MQLYGTDNVPRVPAEVANPRIEMLKERIAYLRTQPYSEINNYTVNEALKGIKHWTRLRDGEDEHE
jgi:hypothetical protein